MILVKVKLVMEVVVVLKMVLMEVDHAMNVEGNREAAKLANWFTKRSVMTSSVTSLSTLLASFSTTLSINWSITIPNTTSPHLRCHKNSQAIWRSSVGLPGSPVVFMSQKSVFFRDTLYLRIANKLFNTLPGCNFEGYFHGRQSADFISC